MSDNEQNGLGGLFHSGRVGAFVVPVLVAAVFLGGVVRRNAPEIYPFASWGMFASVPSRLSMSTLMIHAIDGEALVPPKPVFLVPRLGATWLSPKALSYVSQHCEMIRRASAGMPDAYGTFLDTRAAVEGLFAGHAVEYEPIQVQCNPLYFLRDGTVDSAISFGLFKTGEGLSSAQIKQHSPQPAAVSAP